MNYRRDVQQNEQIPLPVETVYNSKTDSLNINENNYYHLHENYFNRLYFKHPPEWKTSNNGEKIIGVRNMKINRRYGELRFILYIRLSEGEQYSDILDAIDEKEKEDNKNENKEEDNNNNDNKEEEDKNIGWWILTF